MTPFIIAELSCNHGGSLIRALETIEAAKKAGADAVKIQCWTPGTMTLDSGASTGGLWKGQSLTQLYAEAWTPQSWWEHLLDAAESLCLECFASVFDAESMLWLERNTSCPRYKIASFELTDVDLIAACAKTGKPLILSTGMATSDEICRAWYTAHNAGARDITVLKCTSAYPTEAPDVNLRAMLRIGEMLGTHRIGLSDHTLGSAVAVAATALGATMIEKHFTLSRADGGPDSAFSMEPHEFARMATDCRTAAAALGTAKIGPRPGEHTDLRRSVWVIRDLSEGETLTREHCATARPASGLEPYRLPQFLGKRAIRRISKNSPLRPEDFDAHALASIT